MNSQHLQDIELGERVRLYFIVENDLHPVSRETAIQCRFSGFGSKVRTDD